MKTIPAFLLIAGFSVGLASGPSWAARVEGLYAAEVPLPEESASPLEDAFSDALGRVLVKVTGRREIVLDPAILEGIGSPRALLQQYRLSESRTVWAKFDRAALQRKLDSTDQPIWGADRPETLIWLAIDAGSGRREILGQDAGIFELQPVPGPFDAKPAPEGSDAVREALLQTAELRGVPLVLPLMDSEDLTAVSMADIWGDFTDPVLAASVRYGVDAILIGKVRLFDTGSAIVRWTLLIDDERFDWNGDIAEGPHGLADRFAMRLATSVTGTRRIKLSVTGIDTFSQYGEVANYLKAMMIVESCEVQRVSGNSVIFQLTVRGDQDRLMRTIALRQTLQPAAESPGSISGTNSWPPLDNTSPDLEYHFSGTLQ